MLEKDNQNLVQNILFIHRSAHYYHGLGVPYFHGMQCQQLNPDTLIIGIILFSAGVINAFLTFVHNCKIGKSSDPQQLVYEKEKGEMYKGHRWYALQEMNDRRFHIKYLVRIKYSASNAKFPTNINLQYEKYVCLLFQLPIQNYYLVSGGITSTSTPQTKLQSILILLPHNVLLGG